MRPSGGARDSLADLWNLGATVPRVRSGAGGEQTPLLCVAGLAAAPPTGARVSTCPQVSSQFEGLPPGVGS